MVYNFNQEYNNAQLCSDVSWLGATNQKYQNDKVTYNVLVGPNSNTFVAWILDQAPWMSLPGATQAYLAVQAPGWFAVMPPNP